MRDSTRCTNKRGATGTSPRVRRLSIRYVNKVDVNLGSHDKRSANLGVPRHDAYQTSVPPTWGLQSACSFFEGPATCMPHAWAVHKQGPRSRRAANQGGHTYEPPTLWSHRRPAAQPRDHYRITKHGDTKG
ncbi:uncharacterized protein LOC143197558 [Rhynchophorus ferrugineus]|uniref:uncharacterized protein LOC143197558 n=1 Tax=Rhynchophorus ferrugineus TaxID=354439 RepID=UPI003FCE4922